MPKVTFKFNKEKDLWNHWHKATHKGKFSNWNIHPEVEKICKGKEFKDCFNDLEKHFSKIHNSKLIKIYVNSVSEAWKTIEKEFFIRMDKLMKKKYKKDITAYLTTLNICPYNPNEPSYMFSLFYGLLKSLQTSGHEIMHLYFHEFYWKKVEEKIGKEKTGDLKEALTILLNEEFNDLWFQNDTGYEMHKDLREFILKEWKKKKDINILLNKCIKKLS